MPIRFFCPSGHRLSAPESQQGKLIRCPACKQAAIVPTVKVEDVLEQVAGEALGEAPRAPPVGQAFQPDSAPEAPAVDDEGVVFEEVAESPWSDSPEAEGTASSPAVPVEGERSPGRQPAPPPLPARGAVGQPKGAGPPVPAGPQVRRGFPAPSRASAGARPRSAVGRGARLIGPETAPPDPARVEAMKWLALWLGLIVMFSVGPAVMHANLAASPGWARAVLLLAALEAAYVAWMLASPDWSSAWVLMLVFAAGATLSAAAAGAALVTPRDQPMPLGLGEIRAWAAAWFGAVLAVQGLGAYLAGRTSIRWHADARAARLRGFMGQGAAPAGLPFSRRACSP